LLIVLSVMSNDGVFLQGYKYIVMSMLPGIQTLDFSRITKADRRTAATLEGMNKNLKKRRGKPKTEDD